MDHGHGLVDRLFLTTPLAYRPTLSEVEAEAAQPATEVVDDLAEHPLKTSETRQGTFNFNSP